MRHLVRVSSALLALSILTPSALSQTTKLEDRFTSARALYYTPTTAGLTSFACKASVDWKSVLSVASGDQVKDDNPFLTYLNTVHLAVNDRLHGEGALEWSDTATPPKQLEDAAAKMKDGAGKMLAGFFQSWNAYLDGSMVPIPDKTTRVEAQGSGIHLHAATTGTTLDEDFDQNMLLTKVHVVTPETDVVAMPIFSDTPDGRLISEIRNEVHQPVTAPPTYMNLSVMYQPIGGYQIPATIHYDLKNVLRMDFVLTDCTVNPGVKQKAPSMGTP